MFLPTGNLAYRANLFSAISGAFALTLLYLILIQRLHRGAAFVGALAFGLSNPFWELCAVSEMYSLGVAWTALLLWAVLVRRDEGLFGFLMGLGLGVRMDLLLLV